MKKAKLQIIMSTMVCASMTLTPLLNTVASAATTTTMSSTATAYKQHFLDLYGKINDTSNGYYRVISDSQTGKTLKVPYHSVETFMCEAPDYGHETTSEAYSYYMWLEAMYGNFTGDWSKFGSAWDSAERYIIPQAADQPGMSAYNASSPATLANEYPTLEKYPSKLAVGAPVGKDPISDELKNAYGTSNMYGMHWLLDVDNWYGFGNRGDMTNTDPSYINTFQRGQQESVWETVPQPCFDKFQAGGKNGYLDLFTGDSSYSKQWKYTDAPDADARAIQATYWANEWAKSQGKDVSSYVSKATKMGDYLRYSMFDKYFKNIGVGSQNGDQQNTSEHYLLSWYYAWGGGADAAWSWKIGCSHNHFGYQNPMTAWIMSKSSDFKPKSTNGQSDWDKSLSRQLEFYQWLQSSEGAIAGGATNSFTSEAGSYQNYPAGTSTFYGMAYDWAPVYRDPPSNQWFGMQTWSMQRVAELYYKTGNTQAKAVLDKWVKWVNGEVKLNSDGTYQIPSDLSWTGQPDTWKGTSTGNPNLHVKVLNYTDDIGTAASLADTLTYYAAGVAKYDSTNYAKSEGPKAITNAKGLLDDMWKLDQDSKGLSRLEARQDYSDRFFDQTVYIPSGWTGKMPNGDAIQSGVKFLDIRSKYKLDPDYQKVKAAHDSKTAPTFRYHRFWQESEAALAFGVFANLYDSIPKDSVTLKGDINGDGTMDSTDYLTLQKYVVGGSATIDVAASDLNGDGKVNAADLFLLKKMIVGQ